MHEQIIECVPNFSEGRNPAIIKEITDTIERCEGVKLLDVDAGVATNRTVVTFVGNPQAVVNAAFEAIKKAASLIDMRNHSGEHPRMGATDVCPLIPVSGISMEETVKWAHQLAERVGNELDIPVYCYESAAKSPQRKNLADCRSGEYEGLEKKFADANWTPDYGPTVFNESVARTGATAIGARDFLIAINYNLNTTSVRRANAISFDVREKGRPKRVGGKASGEIAKDENGNEIWTPGTLKGCKAIGWFIDEYGIAQVSMNVTNINETPVHIAFDEVSEKAWKRGLRVSGSEIVGLIPLKVLTDAGKYYLQKQKRSAGVSESELIKIAIKSMGLDDLKPFNPQEKVIEYLLSANDKRPLIQMSLKSFAEETASESPAPGGGSVAAYLGALGAALGTMVANLSAQKSGWEKQWKKYSDYAEEGQALLKKLIHLVDEDTAAFNKIMHAFSLPKNTDSEKLARKNAIQDATKYAIEVPLQTMHTAFSAYPLLEAMAKDGNPNSVSDAGVGALCTRAAIYAAWLNVKINAGSYTDENQKAIWLKDGEELLIQSDLKEKEILAIVHEKI